MTEAVLAVELVEPRLLDPPRLVRFCPGEHCGRFCDPASCTCPPCNCTGCRARTRKARRGRLSGQQVEISKSPQPRLFPSPSTRSSA